MKLLTLLIFVMFVVCGATMAQPNLVPNCSFENYTQCPTGGSQTIFSTGWRQYTVGNSDYFNSCTSNPSIGVPSNGRGFQYAAHGTAYTGGCCYIKNDNRQYKEYVARDITPLIPGASYEVSMSVSLSNNSKYGTNDLGVFFFKNWPVTITTLVGPVPVTPQVSYSNYGVIMDTTNWVRLTKTFVADSAYDNMVIGGFSPYANLFLDSFGSPTSGSAYYLFDSIVVKLADSFSISYLDGLLCAGDTLHLPYFALKNYASNNVFTVQLSNASGNFSSPVNIGSINSDTSGIVTVVIPTNTVTGTGYSIRMVASNFADTTKGYGYKVNIVNMISAPVASSNSPVCPSDTLRVFATAPQNATYNWAGPGSYSSTAQNPQINQPIVANSGDYIVTATLYGCLGSDTVSVVVNPNVSSSISAMSNSPVCESDTLRLTGTASGTGLLYSWVGPNGFTSNASSSELSPVTTAGGGDYILKVDNGKCLTYDTVTLTVKPLPVAFSAGVNVPCTGDVLTFSASSSSGGVTYLWSGPNMFTSGSATPSIAGTSPVHNGDYYVTATLNGCSLKDTVTVAVKPLPAKPVANNDVTLCSGNTINLTSTSTTNGVSYSWTGPASYVSTAQNPVLNNSTTSMSGSYIVTATYNGCTSTDTTVITVNQAPAAVTLSSNSPQCAGSTLTLNSTASTTGTTYAWSGPSSYSAATQNASVMGTTTSSSGSYVMTVTLNGCTYKDTLQATVNPIPAAPVVTATQPICVGETLQLSTNTVSGATYTWTGPNGFSSSAAVPARNNITANDAGAYQAIATVNGCSSSAGSATVSINPVPFVTIFSTPTDTICNGENVTFLALPNNAGGTPQYNWLVNGQPVSMGTVYNTTQLAQGDVVRCDMTEYTKCSMPYKDESNDIALEVLPWLAPSVSITASPNRTLKPDEYVTFTAIPVNGGANPKCQWKRNGNNIVGATGNIWSANTLNDNDKITVELISDYRCPQPATSGSNEITVRVATGVDDLSISGNLALYPNPNNGQFLLKGELSVTGAVTISVVNYLGQQVYSADATINNGELNHEVSMLSAPAGVYLLRLNTAEGATQSVRFTKY